MGDTDGRGRLVDMLPACAAGAIGINPNIVRIDLNINILLDLRHNITGHKGGLAFPAELKVEIRTRR